MSRHLVDDPHKTDAQHALKTQLMTNELRDMSFGHKRDANEAKDPAGEVFDIVSCRFAYKFQSSY